MLALFLSKMTTFRKVMKQNRTYLYLLSSQPIARVTTSLSLSVVSRADYYPVDYPLLCYSEELLGAMHIIMLYTKSLCREIIIRHPVIACPRVSSSTLAAGEVVWRRKDTVNGIAGNQGQWYIVSPSPQREGVSWSALIVCKLVHSSSKLRCLYIKCLLSSQVATSQRQGVFKLHIPTCCFCTETSVFKCHLHLHATLTHMHTLTM